jgi:hypothetical protein
VPKSNQQHKTLQAQERYYYNAVVNTGSGKAEPVVFQVPPAVHAAIMNNMQVSMGVVDPDFNPTPKKKRKNYRSIDDEWDA